MLDIIIDYLSRQQFDLPTIGVWGIAATSLLIQVYLFVTWPRPSKSSDLLPEELPRHRVDIKAATSTPQWKAPSDAALDGILGENFPTANNGDMRQRRRKKVKTPVTLQKRIVRAGIYRKGGMRAFHFFRFAIAAVCLLSGCFIVPFTSLPWSFAIYIGAFFGLFGYLTPSFWLDQQLRTRQTMMRRALPDALDLITVCLQGGLSLPAALSRVSRELGPAHPLLATELAIVEREIQMGRNTGGAMMQFADRFDLEELRSLSSVIGQTEKFGGTIAGALKTYAESLRVRRRQHAEEMAQKAAVKLLFPTLFCIFPGIFVVILGPTAMRMYQILSEVSFGG